MSRQPRPEQLHHDHIFGQDRRRPGETRTWWVIALTGSTMVLEIAAGMAFGSMALLADGLHMASHAVALAVTAAAYLYARRHARDQRYSFGTGKVNALAGFASAVLLALFALLMAGESLDRFLHPVPIRFNEAIAVAIVGLLVNGFSVLLLNVKQAPRYGPGDHPDRPADHDHHGHHDQHGEHLHHHHDHNLRAAYLHVLADALTSLLAIAALLAGKLAGAAWMDPLMGIVGALLVARWSWGLLRQTAQVLLDRQAGREQLATLLRAMQQLEGTTVSDLHLWSIGPGYNAACISVTTNRPHTPTAYRLAIPRELNIRHATIEVHLLPGSGTDPGAS